MQCHMSRAGARVKVKMKLNSAYWMEYAPMILSDVETGTRMEEGSATPASTRSIMLRAALN